MPLFTRQNHSSDKTPELPQEKAETGDLPRQLPDGRNALDKP